MPNAVNVVAFQNPYPPTYGGVIDVFYLIKALHSAGYKITLHCFVYGDRRTIAPELEQLVDTLYVYERRVGLLSNLSVKPYIVNSRRDSLLLQRLAESDDPIILEGLHSCYYLGCKELQSKRVMVRTHNVEHHYYAGLARSERSLFKRCYFAIEALRLKLYEKHLSYAEAIAAISYDDEAYFKVNYPGVRTFHVPCFYNDSQVKSVERPLPFVLYQGNLAVAENEDAALRIALNVATKLPKLRFVIAGSNPSNILQQVVAGSENVELIANPSQQQMDQLIATAKVNLLLTKQATGIKLKLLNALCRGWYVVVNSLMVKGTGLEQLCDVADSDSDIAEMIARRMNDVDYVSRTLPDLYSSKHACDIIISKFLNKR
jgi:glycosyltransferase involved in cell wall biosynthesis